MIEWSPPSDNVFAVGKPATPGPVRAVRDLTQALAMRVTGAPWLNGSANVLVIRDFGPIYSDPYHADQRKLSGEWTVPDGVYRIEVTLIGGGGSGGTVIGGDQMRAAGGGGAGALVRRVVHVEPGQRFFAKIGAGGNPASVHSSVDTTLDEWERGDGARTVFGPFAAAGGKRGVDGNLAEYSPSAGAGGYALDGQPPTVRGADGWGPHRLTLHLSGAGGGTVFGAGAPGRIGPGYGYSASIPTMDGDAGIPGAGGGGGAGVSIDTRRRRKEIGIPEKNYVGGRGANGVVIVRY